MNDRYSRRSQRNLLLDRYEQGRERGKVAGEGASGIVIKAQDTADNGRYVAIKRPNPMLSLVERRKKSAQIAREGEALKRLNHNYVCRYVDDGIWQRSNDHYLVTSWADGQQIEARLRQLERSGKLFPLGEALEVLSQLADLLVYAHQAGVIHNDLDAKHLYWDTRRSDPQLTVIDWANCALSSDDRPIAAVTDDLRQYGELMHRLLTGSTVAYASRLGGEENWRVEMAEKELPQRLQDIVGRAIGRDPAGPYEDMGQLYADLQAYKQEYDSPIQNKIDRIAAFLEENTLDSLGLAEALINEVAFWNPVLVVDHTKQLHYLKRQRAETVARIGGKTSLLAEHWGIARDEIATTFGDDIHKMPQLEERYIYLLGELMDNLEVGSHRYKLGQQAVATLFKAETPDENAALDKILLLFGLDMPDRHPLIEALSDQTGRHYPLRSRIRRQIP